jgi:RNA polymerase sigma factor (sigma-70 family)
MDNDQFKQAVATYIADHQQRLIRTLMQPRARRQALTAVEAEDAILKAWGSLQQKLEEGSFKWRDGHFSAFVDKTVEFAAVNLARSIRRRKDTASVEGVLEDEGVEPAAATGGDHDPVAAAQVRQRATWIQWAMEQLEPSMREVVRLKVFAERSWEEIAKVLATTVSKARTMLKNALWDLQQLLPPEGHLAESGEPLQVVFLDLAGDIHRLAVALRPRPITDEDGRLVFRMLAPVPGAVAPAHAFALLRLDDGQVVFGGRPAPVHLQQDPENRESWLARIDVRRLDGNLPNPGSALAGIWIFALPKAPAEGLGRIDSPTP